MFELALFALVYVVYCLVYVEVKEKIDEPTGDFGSCGLGVYDAVSADDSSSTGSCSLDGWSVVEPRNASIRELKEICKNLPSDKRIKGYGVKTKSELDKALGELW